MPNTPSRRFTILDAMVLVAITAVALAAARFAWRATFDVYKGATLIPVHAFFYSCGWFLMVETIGLAPLFLRGPRPPLRRLARQPGMIALIAVASTFAFSILGLLLSAIGTWLVPNPGVLVKMKLRLLILGYPSLGVMVAVCWTILVLGWGWRPARDWPDRLGRFWGVVWIAAFFVANLLMAYLY